MRSVVCVGEVMVELSGLTADGVAHVGFGGDTANTAIYLSRLSIGQAKIGYLSRIGNDSFGSRIVDSLQKEGLELPKTVISPNRQTGLYAIEVSDNGDRSFSYWRKESPAREVLSGPNAKAELEFASSYSALYFSGITLAIMNDEGRASLLKLVNSFRADGRVVMFDINYRPSLWKKSLHSHQIAEIYTSFIKSASIVKGGLDEFDAVFSIMTSDEHAAALRELGADSILISRDLDGLDIFSGVECQTVVPAQVENVVDTTSAGDSFNGGFLHEYLKSRHVLRAVKAGQALAARVVMHQGAIIPQSAMHLP
ncbi:MAG: sugar kinase [Paracoccaceae bacterium]